MLPLVFAAFAVFALASSVSGGSVRWMGARVGTARIFRILEGLAASRPSLPKWFIFAMVEKESGFRTTALHGGREDSIGLFQINWNAHGRELSSRGIRREDLYRPEVNASYWGELAERIRQAAIARGFTPPGLWYAIRLRLKGIGWDDFDRADARASIASFAPILSRWESRLD